MSVCKPEEYKRPNLLQRVKRKLADRDLRRNGYKCDMCGKSERRLKENLSTGRVNGRDYQLCSKCRQDR